MSERVKIQQWMINLAIVLIIGAYGFIFSSVLDRITKNENKIESFNPVLLQIQTDLAEIKTNTAWLMKSVKE